MGGGGTQRPWWRGRWLAQVRGLQAFVRDKLEGRAEAARVEPESAMGRGGDEAETEALQLRRLRVESQLRGLKQRDRRRGRRRRTVGEEPPL